MSLVADFDFQALEPLAPPRRRRSPTPRPSWTSSPRPAPRPSSCARPRAAEGFAAGRADAVAALEPALAALHAGRSPTCTPQQAEAADAARAPRGRARPGAGREDRRRRARRSSPSGSSRPSRGALRGIVERERVTVLVNPDDLEIVREAMDGLQRLARRHRALRGPGRAARRPRRLHRAHAGGRHRRARRDQARAGGRGRRRRARPLMISARCR